MNSKYGLIFFLLFAFLFLLSCTGKGKIILGEDLLNPAPVIKIVDEIRTLEILPQQLLVGHKVILPLHVFDAHPGAINSIKVFFSRVAAGSACLGNPEDPAGSGPCIEILINGYVALTVDQFGEYEITILATDNGRRNNGEQGIVQHSEKKINFSAVQSGVITGNLSYKRPKVLNNTNGGPRIDYSQVTTLNAPQILIWAKDANDTIISYAQSDGNGQFNLAVPASGIFSVFARSVVRGELASGCHQRINKIQVMDDTDLSLNPQQVYDVFLGNFSAASNINFAVDLVHDGNNYTNRSSASFAILDTVLKGLDFLCNANIDFQLPELQIHWSVFNSTVSGNKKAGEITASHYLLENQRHSLYLLGKEDNDTDEFDEHVILHEFIHFIHAVLWRSDTIGGEHFLGQILDARVAFHEGLANAMAAMILQDQYYVDTFGNNQNSGLAVDIVAALANDDKGIFSERSTHYFLYNLFMAAGNNPANIIHTLTTMKLSEAFYTLNLFTKTYAYNYGDIHGLTNLWESAGHLNQPLNALCPGACAGVFEDGFDTDNDLGAAYTATRRYPAGGSFYDSDFWRSYYRLSAGANSSNFNRTRFGSYVNYGNKWGNNRWYVLTGTGKSTKVHVHSLGNAACNQDVLDMAIWLQGKLIDYDYANSGLSAGCPSVTFFAETGRQYLVTLQGKSIALDSWVVQVE